MESEHQTGDRPIVSDEVISGMLGVATEGTGRLHPGPEAAARAGMAFGLLLRHGKEWLKDDTDPRGIVLREYAARLGALITQADGGQA
jgi:hypothetical protein